MAKDPMQALKEAVEEVMDLVDANEVAKVARKTIALMAAMMLAIMNGGKETEHANATIMVAVMAAMNGGFGTRNADARKVAMGNVRVNLMLALDNAIGKGDKEDKNMEAVCAIMAGLCKYLK